MVAQTDSLALRLSRVLRLEHWNDRPLAAERSDFGPWTHSVESGAVVSYRADADPGACGQCGHTHDRHRPYSEPGDDEAWSFCMDCGGRCEFVEVA